MAANKVRLSIAGSNYVLLTNDSEEYMQELAERLDKNINEAMAASESMSVTAAAILTALDYLDELKKNAASADNMRAQIKDYLEDAAQAKLAAESARREVERLRGEVQKMRGDNH